MPLWIKNCLKLLLCCFVLWFFFAMLTPLLENQIPAWKRYNKIQEEQNLDSGALYYSNVPQTFEAEQNMRRAVKEGMNARRKNALEKLNDAKK